MSSRLACSLSSRIAAVAPVDFVYYPPLSASIDPAEVCPDTKPIPMAAIVGEDDLYFPFHGGTSASLPFLTGLADVESQVMPAWATHNGCLTTPSNSAPFPGVRLAEYPACIDGATTRLYVVEDVDGPGPLTDGMGHHWPDSIIDPVAGPGQVSLGLNTHLMSATDVIWDFFAAHSLAPAATSTPGPTPATPTPSPTPAPATPGSPTPATSTPGPTTPTPTAGPPAPVGGKVELISHEANGPDGLLWPLAAVGTLWVVCALTAARLVVRKTKG
jgi:hypothetical protein